MEPCSATGGGCGCGIRRCRKIGISRTTSRWADVITNTYHPRRRSALIALKITVRLAGIYRRSIWNAEFKDGQYTDSVTALLPDEFDDIAARMRGFHSADYYGMGMQSAGL